MVLNLFQYPKGSVIYVDRLYGSISLVEALAQKKILLSCKMSCRSSKFFVYLFST